MAVKDLVGLFESRSKLDTSLSPSPPRSRERKVSQGPRTPTGLPPRSVDTIADVPTPSPAKFLAHPLLRRREPSTADQEDDPILTDPTVSGSSTLSNDLSRTEDYGPSATVVDADVTDELSGPSRRPRESIGQSSTLARSSGWGRSSSTVIDDGSAIELNPLLPSATRSGSRPRSATIVKAHYSSSSTTTLVSPAHNLGPHSPIALSQILVRDAAPVSLPQLDGYISSMEMPSFPECHSQDSSQGKGKGKAPAVAMFPPLERLTGTTLADLESNAKVPPAWRNRQSIFGSLLNVALGVTASVLSASMAHSKYSDVHTTQGSSAIAPFYSVQGLIDTLQIFALILSTFCKFVFSPR